MKNIIIGDEHGRGKFNQVYEVNKARTDIQYFVCVGDYFDPYNQVSDEDLLFNFNTIVAAAKEDSRIKLLLGNHDIHYLVNCDHSRYNYELAPVIKQAIVDNIDMFSLVIDLGNNTIVSHAGITEDWLKEHKLELSEVNSILRSPDDIYRCLAYNNHDVSGYGEASYQSCVWVRPNGLVSAGISGYTQIVGHTDVENMYYFLNVDEHMDNTVPYHDGNFYFVDTGDNFTYLELDISE